ncbi:vacuolar ATPase assembly integral membrane protein VMA21 homolog [Pectinophora gossypiella]|uniref:vacuolar ATPase assembly integral membrane protein VMA21 homolog n=1 Tax=Pectinophora gossypiella TaxID=13191 RepID=UPI00214F5339|nr:vacuolar ATPase assembly integral membrane protein VMA21 homolog [Pectinophora gossypiella]
MIAGKANEMSDFQVLSAIVKYCLMIISIPVLSFFLVKVIVFDGILRLEPIPSSVSSAVVAILVLHVALGTYIYKAYSEAEKAPKPTKKD